MQDGKEIFVQHQTSQVSFSTQKGKSCTLILLSKLQKKKYWKHLDIYYMTEEWNDSSNPNIIIEHKLTLPI